MDFKNSEETIKFYNDAVLQDDEQVSLEDGSNLLDISSYILSIKDYITDNINESLHNRIGMSSFNKFNNSVNSHISTPSDSDSEVVTKSEYYSELNKNILDKLQDLELLFHEEKNKNYAYLKNLENKIIDIENENKKLADEVYDIYDQLYDAETRIIEMEQYNRRQNIIITGIPESINQNKLETTVINIFRSIGLQISSYEIVGCHRLFKSKNSKYPAKTIVRFTNRKAVEFCMLFRKRLIEVKSTIGMNLRFQENLCESNETVLKWSRELKKHNYIYDYYIRNGYIKIVINKDEKPKKIHHPHELYKMFDDFIDHIGIYIT